MMQGIFFFPVALHIVLFREQALERAVIGLTLLTYTALFSPTLGCDEVSLLAWLAKDAANSGAGKKGGFVHINTLLLACCLLLTSSKAGMPVPAAQM